MNPWIACLTPLLLLLSVTCADAREFDIDWIVEGRAGGDFDPGTGIAESAVGVQEPVLDAEERHVEFITGNAYSIGDYELTIDSDEGQRLNRMLIEQRDLRQDSFMHKIRHHDRFSDGYVQIAEALLDPVGQQMYLIKGKSYDHYPNSNLEYFVLERGYSLDDLEAIPNDIFSPASLDRAREVIAHSDRHGGSFDLRELSPNYMRADEATMKERMVETISRQTMQVYERILAGEKTGRETPDIALPVSGIPDIHDGLAIEAPVFEDTRHVRDMLQRGDAALAAPRQDATIHVALMLVPVLAGLAILGYFARRRLGSKPLARIADASTTRGMTTRDMLEDSMSHCRDSRLKEAHEALGRAIRHYYAYGLGISEGATNFEILSKLQESDSPDYSAVRRLLLLCGGVEYAKFMPTRGGFLDAYSEFSSMVDNDCNW